MVNSSDFSGGILDEFWLIEGPSGTAVRLATSATDAFLELVTPDGSHDVWQANNGARALQATADTDFQLEAKFLSTPSQKYQLQGFLIEQDAQNWIRLDTYFDGASLRAFGAVTVNGNSSAKFNLAIPGNAAPYLQMTRSGDLWSLEYSTDGASWVTAGSFTHAMTVTAAGLFAGNTGAATGFTAQVDWFENTASPIVDEDGTITPVNVAPVAGDDALATDQDTPLVIDVTADLLANDSDSNGDALTVASFTQPGNGTLVDNGDGTLSYTPAAGYTGADSFTYTVSDGFMTDTAAVAIAVVAPASSDDFSGGPLASVWSFQGIDGFAQVATNATDGFLEIHSPEGVVVSASDVLTTPRVLQSVSDEDFQISAGFLTEPAAKYQEHGLLVVQDSSNWIRFDLAYTGSTLKLIVGMIEGGSTSYPLFQSMGAGVVKHLRITRTGDDWNFEYSTDGTAWTQAYGTTRALTVTQTGLFAGSNSFDSDPPGYVARVDYFENTASPIVDEDGTITPVNVAPVAGDDALATDQDTPLVIDVTADLLANDSDSNGDALTVASFTQPGNGTLVDNGDGTLSYTPAAGYTGADSFTYTVSDGAQTDTATVNLTVSSEAPPPASSFVSDDFSDGVLDPAWTAAGPAGTAVRLATSATDAFLELVTPDGSHDVWKTNNGARALQATADTDFQLSAKFLSTPSQKYQLQGFLIEQDAQNWIRLDTYFDGSSLRAFGAVTVNGNSSAKFNLAIPGNAAPYLQMTRSGDLWSLEYSTDGASWVTAGSFTHAMTVTAAGLFAGNTGAATGFTAQVDWFENTASPLVDEDGTITLPNDPPIAIDDSYALDTDGSLVVSAGDGVLRNDVDPDDGPLAVVLDRGPTNGTVTLNADGSFTYSADTGYVGPDDFTYVVSDDLGASAAATVTLKAANTPPQIMTGTSSFTKVVVDNAMPLTHIALAADFDLDGDLDIVSTAEGTDTVAWFENDGSLSFTRHDIDTNLESAYPASLADLDLDGDMDVLVGGYRADQYIWYENNGAGGFSRNVIASQDGPHSIFAVDMDADGDLDLITAGQDSNRISWFENDGSQSFSERLIDNAAMAAKSAVAVDLDNDGDIDVVSASYNDDTIAWYENDGAGTFTKRSVDTTANGAYFATAADLDGDGDLDIVSASRLDNSIAWYRNDGGVFTKALISGAAMAARYISAVDMDGDGDGDVLSASVDDNTIALYLNDGLGNFDRIVADSAAIGAYGAVPIDMNGDGLTDILGASKTDGTISVLLQKKAHEVSLAPGENLGISTELLKAVDGEQSAATLVYTLVAAPSLGQLEIDGVALSTGATFTQSDIDTGGLSYRQTGSVEGEDYFRLSLSDGLAPASTASFTLAIGDPPPASSFVSDDFSDGVLDPAWTAAGPMGTEVRLGTSATDAFLELVTPDGSHDVWQTNNGARALQATTDTDFQLSAKFLSTPSQKFQLQGFLIEQDADNWIRLDTYFAGSSLRAFGAVTVDGNSSAQFNLAIPGNAAPYLQMTRSGDLWSLAYSTDGASWVTAGSFTHAMTVTAAGLFAGNTGAATGFTAQVDWFENTASPIVDEDGTITPVNVAPVAGDDALATDQDTPLVIDVTADLLANDSDSNGDALTVASFTQPGNGTLVDNGDGTLSYTPAAGYTGADSFTYTVSDGAQTDTATVNLTVSSEAPPPASSFVSDDFSDGVLDPAWTAAGPAGTAVRLGASATDAFLELVTPDGSHDVWKTNNGARALQATADTDFQLEAKFLSTPSQKYQLQGFLIEQDAQNWIRLDTYFDGSSLRAFGAVTVNGNSSAKFNLAIPGNAAPYLQMTRSGDLWSLEYSTDGANWVTAGSFTHAMTVTAAGLFAGNTGAATGFTAQVDWFENTASPIVDEDGTITPVNVAPVAGDDALATDQDTPLVIDVTADLLANDSDSNGDALTVASFTQPGNGTLVDNGDGTLSYTPAAGYTGADSFTYTVSDGAQTDTATVNLTVSSEAPPPASSFVSDDFSDGVLDPAWTAAGPAGTAVRLATSATDAFLELVTPDGSHDVWQTNNGARALQATADTDFQLEAKFLSTPSQKYQLQGFLIEQDAQNWIRLDTYFDGSSLRAFGAVTVNGNSSAKFNLAIPGNAAPYLQMTRSGDLWSLEYSTDGASWVTAGSFTHAMTVTAAGLFAGNTGAATGFTAQVDWFENTASPLVDEDGTITPVNVAPVAGDDALATDQDTPLVIDVTADLLANDSDSNGDALTVASFTQPGNGTLVDNGDGTLSYTPAAGYTGADSFTYTVSDGAQTDTATVNLTVSSEAPPPASSFVSDDFSDGVLDPAWTAAGPAGTAVRLATSATDAFLELVTPDGSHDVWKTNNGARALQATADTDFQLSAKFLSTPSQKYQLQGFLIEQDAQNWIRLDTYFDGSSLRAFGAVTVNGNSSAKFNLAIPGNAAPYLQMTRSGDLWSLEYSTDGASWVTAGSFTHAMTVTAAGLFAGNTGAATGFTAQVDWFENTASPIVDEDGTYEGFNAAPSATDDVFVVFPDTAFSFDDTDLLANDSDSNGDALTVASFTQPGNGTLVDNGDGTYTYIPNQGFQGAATFSYTISDGEFTDTADVVLDVGHPIDLWYGVRQSFGNPGEGQEWINILGNVAGNVASLTYTLNGGPARTLSMGPDDRRLQEPGDFNVDISYAELDGTVADDLVEIAATYADGTVWTEEVLVEYESNLDWPKNYSIDWETVSDIQSVVQVVDGKWETTPEGVRPVETGYDRLLVLGDQNWDNYQIDLTIEMHDITVDDPIGILEGFAIGMLWGGHTETNSQPYYGYEPGASIFYTGKYSAHSYHEFSEFLAVNYDDKLDEGKKYNFSVKVEQTGIYDRLYSLKAWEVGTAEPVEWTIQGLETFSIDEAPATGSVYLNAHYYDVTFGDLTVTEITGNDIIQGDDSDETLAAVDLGTASPGRSEIDVFVGAGGADIFVFGEAGTVYYDDGIGGESGTTDYGFVWDFASGVDQVQLAGNEVDYTLTENHPGLTAGTAIWRTGEGGDLDELVGVLNGVFGLSLEGTDFIYSEALLV